MKRDELVDLVDATGLIRIRRIRRSDVARRKDQLILEGLYQPIVVVVVVDTGGRIVAHERGKTKAGDGRGEIAHVCGVIASGESWQEAAVRETAEEIGVATRDLTRVLSGVNAYGRHRTLAVAHSVGEPEVVHSDEVARLVVASLDELQALEQGATVFAHEFFIDLKHAVDALPRRDMAPGPSWHDRHGPD